MCQSTQEEFILDASSQDFKKLRKCLKCEEGSVIVTRVNEALCKNCFMEYFTHKFRATIGKNKLFEPRETILFPYSGSASSVAMLNLIKQGVSEEAKKKFLFTPVLLFIEDSCMFKSNTIEDRIENLKKIRDSVASSGFKIYYSLLENCFAIEDKSKENLLYENIEDIVFNKDRIAKIHNLLDNINSLTSKEELIKRLRMSIIYNAAESLNLKKVVLAINLTKLTIELLSNTSQGKAAHLYAEMSLADKRENFTILRPLREIAAKEIAFYNRFVGIEPVYFCEISMMTPPNSTIYRLTERFVTHLQTNFPTTVPTIFRTSDKFSNPFSSEDNENKLPIKCFLCQCYSDYNTNSVNSAISDVDFSAAISRNQATNNDNVDKLANSDTNNNTFKDLNESLCYSCKLILRDTKDWHWLDELRVPKKKASEEELRESIKDFLLD